MLATGKTRITAHLYESSHVDVLFLCQELIVVRMDMLMRTFFVHVNASPSKMNVHFNIYDETDLCLC